MTTPRVVVERSNPGTNRCWITGDDGSHMFATTFDYDGSDECLGVAIGQMLTSAKAAGFDVRALDT